MISAIISGITRAALYVILADLFWRKERIRHLNLRLMLFVTVIVAAHYISSLQRYDLVSGIIPIVEVGILICYGFRESNELKMLRLCGGAIGAYIFSFIINALLALVVGGLMNIICNYISFNIMYVIASVFRMSVVVLIYINYSWFQRYIDKTAVDVIILISAFILFFIQFFQIAYGQEKYSFAVIIILLLYLTMIFTAFMLLQHNRLTAKQQAIEEDNRQMSQRLHRSKDVLGVVSQVVASEEHIDPKLRKELADFCDDEMNEMQDRTLGVNLIGDTGIELVNVMLQKQMMRCADLNISFDVMIPAPVDGYIQNIGISVTEFMRMLNDLLKNAVKAILSLENAHRELLLIMGDAGADCFEIRLYDSGVPFPPVILEHMGERGNTTDGTGNGLADTIETLGHYHASFAIEPIEPGADIYTKCVHIAFDGRGCGA